MNTKQFKMLFINNIYRLDRLPADITTDRDPLFTSELWKETTKQLQIERKMSTAFHPQTDGQTERTNTILEQYLQAYVNYQQDNWTELLLLAEFAYSNSRQETIKHTPFFANYGYHPTYESIGHLTPQKNTNLSQLHDRLREEITLAQLRQKENYDRHRKPDPNLKSEDKVWLNERNIRTTRLSKKLDNKKVGPFTILAKVGKSSYKLEVPPSMRIHSTFHISLLEPYSDNSLPSQRKEPPPPIDTKGEPEYELDELVDSRLYGGTHLQYRAKWTGFPPEHDKVWYPANNFENASIAIERFHQSYPHKPRRGNQNPNQKP